MPTAAAFETESMSTIRLSTTNARAWDIDPGDAGHADIPIALTESWRRAREAGIDPARSGDPGATAIGTELERRRRLPMIARVVVEAEALLIGGTPELDPDIRLAIVDAEGVIVATFGGGDFTRRADAVGFRPGRRWTEADRGTNGIGTALIIGDAVLVRSAAHVERQLHQLASVGVPVHAPDGSVIAVLGLLLPRDLVGQRPARPLRVAARAIERMLAAGDGLGAWSPLPETLERLIARSDAPALLFESPGTIRAASPAGHAMLERLRGDSTARSLADGVTVEGLLGMGWAALAEAAAERGDDPLPVAIGGREDERYLMHLEGIARQDGEIRVVLGLLERPRPRRAAGHLREVSVRTIVGSDPTFIEAKRTAEQFARTDLPVLLVAETGAGKEVLARAIHDSSPRATEPFVAINCGSLSPQLLESELFGYGPGAFTGARPEGHDGKIQAAERGTLFLDEVAEMPPALQSSLLRVLEDGSYYRVGETILRKADIRIICATWRDLPSMIHDERFRQDLYYRIKGACIVIPPLRRRTDISDIVNFLLDKLCFEMKLPQARFTKDAMAMVKQFPWPGNIRELRSAVHHALVLGDGRRMLHPEHLPAEIREHAPAAMPPRVDDGPPRPVIMPEPRGNDRPIRPHPESPAAPGRPAPDITVVDAPSGFGEASAAPRESWPSNAVNAVNATATPPPGAMDRLEDLQLHTLQRVLTETRGNLSETARRLGVARSTLYRLLERHGLRELRS